MQGDSQIFSVPGMVEISAVPNGNSKNLGIEFLPGISRVVDYDFWVLQQGYPRRKSKIYFLNLFGL